MRAVTQSAAMCASCQALHVSFVGSVSVHVYCTYVQPTFGVYITQAVRVSHIFTYICFLRASYMYISELGIWCVVCACMCVC